MTNSIDIRLCSVSVTSNLNILSSPNHFQNTSALYVNEQKEFPSLNTLMFLVNGEQNMDGWMDD